LRQSMITSPSMRQLHDEVSDFDDQSYLEFFSVIFLTL
jgi:hypothetical protein